MAEQNFTTKTKQLIDGLKAVCAGYGLGNSGEEYKIIVQVFLYKFINDKFIHIAKSINAKLANTDNFYEAFNTLSENEYQKLVYTIGADNAKLKKEHLLTNLYQKQSQEEFAKLFDDTLLDISKQNSDIFSVKTDGGAKIQLFEESITHYISDQSKRDNFAKALINQLVDVEFEPIFDQKFDFFATIFEYLIKDYNKDGGGTYAEYYTPHAVSRIMAEILVDKPIDNATVYDPSAGSGTLLMNIAHKIGEDKCTIYSQDISQKSSSMLRLNLILNNLVHSIPNIIQGNTILEPYHRDQKFDFIVSNPPFKLDFSSYRDSLDTKENSQRFFAGIPKIKAKDKKKMEIYLLFIQHIISSLSTRGKAAIVVPTGFITAQAGIEKKIRERIVESKMLKGVVSMPSNIFATTGTNVSILFLDKENQGDQVVLMDASKLGTTIKEDGKNQKTILSPEEEQTIINAFNQKQAIEDLSVVVRFDEIVEKNYSFSAGQYFDIKIEYTDISPEEFTQKMQNYETNLADYFKESRQLEEQIFTHLKDIKYDK
jgi:type I restriction enzyme M protein